MAAMPGMDDEEGSKPKGKGKPIDLAIIMGGKPKGGAPPAGDDEESGEDDGLPHGFEEAASEAFPDLAGDTERLHALKRLIMLCTDSY